MLVININHPQGQQHVQILSLEGALDASNYQELVTKATQVCHLGSSLVLDMAALRFMSSAGIAALHSLVRLLRGDLPHDMQNGWEVFHDIKNEISSGTPSSLKICNLQPNVAKSLQLTGMDKLMEVYSDLNSALASLPSYG